MASLQSSSKRIFCVLILVVMSATYAAADSITLTNGPTNFQTPSLSTFTITNVDFSNVTVSTPTSGPGGTLHFGPTGATVLGIFDVVGTFSILGDPTVYNLFDTSGFGIDLVFSSGTGTSADPLKGHGTLAIQTDWNGFVFARISNSTLVLTSDFLHVASWTIPAFDPNSPSTWKFADSTGGDEGHNTADMVFSTTVPETSSLYLLAMGLGGLGAEVLRRARRTR